MEIKKIVYDVDDVLWGFTAHVVKNLGIDINKMTQFKIRENKLLTLDQQEQVIALFNDSKTFENIVWYDGIKDILYPEKYGISIHINSNCLKEKIAELKTTQLLEIIPIKRENIRCNVIEPMAATKKKIDEDTDILIEDSPYNIVQSPAKINILISQPWNMTDEAREIMKGKSIIRVNSLKEANRIIREYVDHTTEKVG